MNNSHSCAAILWRHEPGTNSRSQTRTALQITQSTRPASRLPLGQADVARIQVVDLEVHEFPVTQQILGCDQATFESATTTTGSRFMLRDHLLIKKEFVTEEQFRLSNDSRDFGLSWKRRKASIKIKPAKVFLNQSVYKILADTNIQYSFRLYSHFDLNKYIFEYYLHLDEYL